MAIGLNNSLFTWVAHSSPDNHFQLSLRWTCCCGHCAECLIPQCSSKVCSWGPLLWWGQTPPVSTEDAVLSSNLLVPTSVRAVPKSPLLQEQGWMYQTYYSCQSCGMMVSLICILPPQYEELNPRPSRRALLLQPFYSEMGSKSPSCDPLASTSRCAGITCAHLPCTSDYRWGWIYLLIDHLDFFQYSTHDLLFSCQL